MTKIIKSILTIILFSVFGLFTTNSFANKILNCSNCKSDKSFGKIYNFDKKVSNLKSDEFVVFWNGYLGTDELIITHKGIIKNSRFIPINVLNRNELCVFGVTDFPSLNGKYPNTILKEVFTKQIKSRYSFWENQFNKKSINEINNICLGKRETFLKNKPLETKYACGLNNSSCRLIKFDGKNIKNVNVESPETKLNLKDWTNARICFFSVNENKTDWTKNYQYIDYVEEAKRRGIDCEITNEPAKSNIFGLDLGKIKPKDPYFHLKRIVLKCDKRNGKSYKKTLMGFISSEFFYSTKTTKQGASLVIGYLNKDKTILKIKGIESYFPNNSKYSYKFETNVNNNIFDTLSQTITGSKGSKEKCTITSSMKWGGDIVPYTGNSFTSKEKKNGLKRAINSLKMFQSKQFDLSQTLAQNNFILGFKFELSDLMTDLTMNLAKLEIEQKDKEAKKLAEQRVLELEEERTRLKAMEIERKRLEEKTKQLVEQNKIAELNAKKRSEEIAKKVAAQEQEKLEKERALRRAEERARKIAQKKAKQLVRERQKAEKVAKQLELEKVIAEKENKERLNKLDEERKKSEKITEQLRKERKIAEQKAKDLEQTQFALLQKEKEKREELEKKLISLQEENKKNRSNINSVFKTKLPPEWVPFENKMSLQQEQFCQLTNRFFEDIKRATKSSNEIKINIVHKERQENLDGLLPGGKVNNWIFKVVKIDQVEDGSAAVVLSLQCKSFVGSGQIHTRSTWRKKSSKEWRATIPYDDRRFRELAKLDKGQFILGSGIMLEINAFKPGQKETFYASQQIGEHPLTKGLNLEGELFIADLSYIAALN